MMAGIIQTLVLRPPPPGNGVFRRPDLHFWAKKFRFSGHPLLRTSVSMSHTLRASGRSSDQVGGSGNKNSGDLNLVKVIDWTQPILDFTVTNFLPLALVTAITFGVVNPTLGCLAHSYGLSKFSTFGIFLISGVTLRDGEIGAAVEAWPAGIFGLGSILFFTPLFSRLILKFQLAPQEFVTGLAIFCCMPTTLSSGVALTQLAGGNSALALAMTVISNLLGILIVPFSLSKLIAGGVGASVPTKQLFGSLIMTLLVPLVLGKVIRYSFHSVAKYVDQNRQIFSMMSAVFLSLDHLTAIISTLQWYQLKLELVPYMNTSRLLRYIIRWPRIVPWIQVSRSRPLLLMVKPAVFVVAIGMGTLLHLLFLALNSIAVWILSVVSGSRKSVFAKKENVRALIIVPSQKTLPVMVAVVEQLGGVLGESGLLVLPCVVAHINQIIIDSFLVNFWVQKDKLSNLPKVT